MKEKDRDIFKELVKAYYSDCFEETLKRMMEEEFTNEEEAKRVLGALCGIQVEETEKDYDFVYQIIQAITKSRVHEKIVQKVRGCTGDCEKVGGKSKCQSVCPFDAIVKEGEEKWIDEEKCLHCGRCVGACWQGNYLETTEFLPLAHLIKQETKVMAIVAPAIAGQFGEGVTLDQLREALVQVGFADMVEVALAADILSLKEAIEFSEHVHTQGDFMITSCCCPMWVAMLRKVYQELTPRVSPSVSPMIAMGRILKKLNPEVKVVFIGPCVAKKAEAKEKDLIGAVDYVLTFKELQTIFEALEIQPQRLAGLPAIDYASRGGRLYARTGGVSQAVWEIVEQIFPGKRELFSAVQADGMKDCKEILKELQAGEVKKSFIEGMGCKGGCVGGPKAIISAAQGKEAVEKVAYESAVKIPVHSEVLLELFKKLEITSLDDLKKQCSLFERQF